jgi:iron-sulfur cluster assembly protein
MVRLTERAAEHVLALMREDPEALALRVAVQGGGCSGLQYALGFDGEPQPGDEVADQHGVKVVVDRFSLPYLSGAEVDFVDGLMGAGFTVNNPNAVASCGCGSSFKAEDDDAAAAGGCSTCSA